MRLISPPLDLSDIVEPKLNYYDLRGWDYLWPISLPEHIVEVSVSTSPNGPWTLLLKDTATTNDFYTWRHHQNISLQQYVGSIIYISFKTNLHHYYWRFDDFCVSDNSSLSTKNNNLNPNIIKVYPNPVNEILYVNSSHKNALYVLNNIYAKEVIKTKNPEINISNLISGIYILQIFSTDKVLIQSLKIIKE